MDSPKKSDALNKVNLALENWVVSPEDIIPRRNEAGDPHPAIQIFLREADPSNPLERPCMAGKEGCLAAQLTNPFNGESVGLWLREFYVPSIWKKIVKLGKLPEKRTHCYYCQRYRSAVRYSLLTFEVDGNVFNRIHLNDNSKDYE